jgi:hypothetical protein
VGLKREGGATARGGEGALLIANWRGFVGINYGGMWLRVRGCIYTCLRVRGGACSARHGGRKTMAHSLTAESNCDSGCGPWWVQ